MDDNGEYTTFCIKPKRLRGAERLMYIESCLNAFLKKIRTKFNNLYAGIEGYSYGSIGRTFELGELGGIIKVLLKSNNINFESIPPVNPLAIFIISC